MQSYEDHVVITGETDRIYIHPEQHPVVHAKIHTGWNKGYLRLEAAGQVEGVAAGVFRYHPAKHTLERIGPDDRREQLGQAAFSQTWIKDSAAVLVITATARRTTWKYGERGLRYIYMEAGHVAQNICLQTVSLGLATTPVGAFRDDQVRDLLELPPDTEPIYLLPIGRP